MELPLDEPGVIGIQGAGEPPPIGEEPESLPIIVDIDLVEELDDGHGVLELVELLGRTAVPLQVVDGLLVPPGDLGGQADASVPGGVGSDREEDVVPGHALVPADGIHVGVSAQMSDMKVSRDPGIREDDHEFRLAVDPLGFVKACLDPTGLPFGFHASVVVRHFEPLYTHAHRESPLIPMVPGCRLHDAPGLDDIPPVDALSSGPTGSGAVRRVERSCQICLSDRPPMLGGSVMLGIRSLVGQT